MYMRSWGTKLVMSSVVIFLFYFRIFIKYTSMKARNILNQNRLHSKILTQTNYSSKARPVLYVRHSFANLDYFVQSVSEGEFSMAKFKMSASPY